MNTFIKICGITNTDDFKAVNASGANAAGFIAYPPSPRYISPKKVKYILNSESPQLIPVGVFVDAEFEEIEEYLNAGIKIIQLHGHETPEFAAKLSKKAEVWKALRPKTIEELKEALDYPADKFLLDTYSPKAKGGTGELGDWNIAIWAVENFRKPIILAGGLNPGNIAEAIQQVKPFGVDLSSGVEISPGIKDHELISQLIQEIKKTK
jgi:phosphoribosylanthranilate isomerase